MHAVQFRRPRAVAMIVALVLALGAVLAFALLSGSTRTAQAATGHHKHHANHSGAAADQPGSTDTDNVQSGDQTTPDTGGGAASSSENPGGPDPGNVQSGDQTSPDTTGASPGESTGSGESSVESEQGQPGEPTPGNTDPAGATGPECNGNCVQ